MKRSMSVLAVACVAVAVPAWAHHSFNTFYDMTRTVQIEGVVTFEDGKVICLGGCPGGPPVE